MREATDRSVLREIAGLVPVALGSIRSAIWSSATIVTCITLMVVVLLVFSGMARGFEQTARNAGSPDVAILLGQQSSGETSSQLTREQVELLANIPGVAARDGRPMISPEFSMTVGMRQNDRQDVNAMLRGLTPSGIALREGFRLVAGRLFMSGRREIIIGDTLFRRLKGVPLGGAVSLAGREWRIVGVFQLSSHVFENEMFGDLTTVQTSYGRDNVFQSVRAKLVSPDAIERIRAYIAPDPRLPVDVVSERQFYMQQATGTANLIRYIGWPLSMILGVGCVLGLINTMSINLDARRGSLRIIRLLGFSRTAMLASIAVETLLLALTGAAIGAVIALIFFDGEQASTIGSNFTTVSYNVSIRGWPILQAFGVAVGIGLLGALLPGWRTVQAGVG